MVVVLCICLPSKIPTNLYYYFCFDKCWVRQQNMSVFTHGVDEFIIRDRPWWDEIQLHF